MIQMKLNKTKQNKVCPNVLTKLNSWISWSTGKDSSFALMKAMENSNIHITGIFSTITKDFDRVSMHSSRKELLTKQARSIGLPLHIVEIPKDCSNSDYQLEMQVLLKKALENKVNSFIFGDLFLESIKKYREDNLKDTGITPVFPIWNYNTHKTSREIIKLGFKAKISCIDLRKLDKSFAGRDYDENFLNALPSNVDPCGENGEFHTFVYDAPIFSFPIKCKTGIKIQKEDFYFTDIIPN